MEFWEFTVCMYCISSSVDIRRFVASDPMGQLPIGSLIVAIFFILTEPARICLLALPIYGFFVIPWWQTILGVAIALIPGIMFTREIVAGSYYLYLWSAAFSVSGITLFVYFCFT